MSAPSTSGLSVELLLRVIDVKYGYFTLLYFTLLYFTLLLFYVGIQKISWVSDGTPCTH